MRTFGEWMSSSRTTFRSKNNTLKTLNLKITNLITAENNRQGSPHRKKSEIDNATESLCFYSDDTKEDIIAALMADKNYDFLKKIVLYLDDSDRVKLFTVNHSKLIRELVPYMDDLTRDGFIGHKSCEIRAAIGMHGTDADRDKLLNDASEVVRESVYQHGNATHRFTLGLWMLSDGTKQERIQMVRAMAENLNDKAKAIMLLKEVA